MVQTGPDFPRRLLDWLRTAVVVLDGGLAVRCMNAAAEELLQISLRRSRGRPFPELAPGNDDLLDKLLRGAAEGTSFTLRGLSLHLPWVGRPLLVDCVITPLSGMGDAVLLVEFNAVDQLAKLVREDWVADRYQANQAMIRGLAHEIKNPLGGLRGAAQLLEEELENGELREYTRIIIHESDRLTRLVDRMRGSHRPLAMVALNVHDVLEHVRKLVLAGNREGLTVLRDYDPSLPAVIGNREQLIQAVLNIVSNAVQAMQARGTVCLRTRIDHQVKLAGDRHHRVVRIDIEDDGPGIPPSIRERIFDPLVTGRAEGTGLGLSISQDILRRHQGLIEVESRPGRTRFSLFLPIGKEPRAT